MELLGNSQTLLGTLATLTILCVFHNDSNFIYKILEDVKKRFEDEIKSLRTNTKIEKITERRDYKLLKQIANNKTPENPKLQAEGIALMARISAAKQQLQFQYVPIEGAGNTLLERIHSSKEQILAPLYTFCYCLIIFMFDELLRIPAIGHINFLCSVLTIFFMISIFFWGFIWSKFLINHIPWKSKEPSSRKEDKSKTEKSLLYSIIKKSIICILFFILGIWGTHQFFLPHRYLYGIIGSFMIPVAYIGYLKLFTQKGKKEYTHLLTLGHLLGFMLLATLLCVIFFIYIEITNSYNDWLNPFRTYMYKITNFCAILLNGLVFPFFMPYLCYYIIYKKAQRNVRDSKTKAEKIEDNLIKALEEFSQKVQ